MFSAYPVNGFVRLTKHGLLSKNLVKSLLRFVINAAKFIVNSSTSSMVCFGVSGGERLTGGKQMDGNRSEVGDERNTPFELPEYTKEVTSGFDPGEEPSEVSEGHDRFPQRLKQEDIPQESLAERIRRDRQGG
jgi:hypothetical protein